MEETHSHLPKADLIRTGPDKGLYDIPRGSCLCAYAQGPCYYHSTGGARQPSFRQLSLWDSLK